MTSFLKNTESYFGQGAQKSLKVVMDFMEVPDAEDGEYLDGTGNLSLFINRYGLVLRVAPEMGCPENDLVVKPLRAATTPNLNSAFSSTSYKIEVLPGVSACLKSMEDLQWLGCSLRQSRISFWDPQRVNAGYLPNSDENFPDGVPVVLDRGAVSKTDDLPLKAPQKTITPGIQERLYAPLLGTLREAWPANENLPVAVTKDFLDACAAEIQAGKKGGKALLINGWAANLKHSEEAYEGCKPGKVVDYAAKYEKRLSRQKTFVGWLVDIVPA